MSVGGNCIESGGLVYSTAELSLLAGGSGEDMTSRDVMPRRHPLSLQPSGDRDGTHVAKPHLRIFSSHGNAARKKHDSVAPLTGGGGGSTATQNLGNDNHQGAGGGGSGGAIWLDAPTIRGASYGGTRPFVAGSGDR